MPLAQLLHANSTSELVRNGDDFIKRLTKEKREYLLFKDFPGSPWFSQFKPEDVLPIYKRFTTTELNQRINAYNICVILS